MGYRYLRISSFFLDFLRNVCIWCLIVFGGIWVDIVLLMGVKKIGSMVISNLLFCLYCFIFYRILLGVGIGGLGMLGGILFFGRFLFF